MIKLYRYLTIFGLASLLSGCFVPSFEEKCAATLPPVGFQFVQPPLHQIEITNLSGAEIGEQISKSGNFDVFYLNIISAGTYSVQLNSILKKFNVTICSRPDITVRLPLQSKLYLASELTNNPCQSSILKEYAQTKLNLIPSLTLSMKNDMESGLTQHYATYFDLADSSEELQAKTGLAAQDYILEPLLKFNKQVQAIAQDKSDWAEIEALLAKCPA